MQENGYKRDESSLLLMIFIAGDFVMLSTC